MNTPKIKLQKISSGEKSTVFSKTQKKYLPDNYYTYDIHRHINTDFHNLKPTKGVHINISCFRVVESRPNKIIQKPFLQYLLYKYPRNIKKVGNVCVFPFEKYKSGEILDIGKKIVKTLFDKVFSPLGYIQNQDGIFLFYNIDFQSLIVSNPILNDNNPHYIWTLIDEICNHKKCITFPIHKSVTNLFLHNPKLIYLKDKKKLCIEVPSVAYMADSQELLNYIASLGIKSSAVRIFGPYYYFYDFNSAARLAGWSSNYEKRQIFNKSITDDNGLYKQGGFVRFAIFLGNYRVVLDRKTDPIMPYVEAYDDVNQPEKKLLDKLKKGKGKWANTYDAIIISNFKNKKRSGYFKYGTEYVLKKFNSFTSLSVHLLDKTTLKPNWDKNYEGYDIK